MASASISTLSIATANCTGNGAKPPNEYKNLAPSIRYELLKQVFMTNDIIMLQEICCMKEIKKNLLQSHYLCQSGQMGILLNTDAFSPDLKSFGKSDFQKYADNFKLNSLEGELVFAVAKPIGWQKTILIVSYHGPTKGDKINTAKNMIKFCLHTKRKTGADFVIIGGDFNLSDEAVQKAVLPEITESTFSVSSSYIPMARRTAVIDYFIYEDGLNVINPQVKQFPREVLVNNELSYEEYQTLNMILDHDPVVAKLALKEDVDRAGQGTKSGRGGVGRIGTESIRGGVRRRETESGREGVGIPGTESIRGGVRRRETESGRQGVGRRGTESGRGGVGRRGTESGRGGVRRRETESGKEGVGIRGTESGRGGVGRRGTESGRGGRLASEGATSSKSNCEGVCGKSFDTYQGKKGCLQEPSINNNDSNDGFGSTVRCRCGRTFNTSHELKIHQGKKGCLHEPSNDDDDDDAYDDDGFSCRCGRSFDTYRGLRIHQGKKGCLPKPPNDDYGDNDDNSEGFKCICGRTFDTYHGLRTHQGKKGCLPKYSNDKDFKCVCGRSFDTFRGLRIHQGMKGCLS